MGSRFERIPSQEMDSADCDQLTTLSAAQAAFLEVRDIPFAAQYQLFYSDERLRTKNGQGCTQKAYHLQRLFTSLDLPTELCRVRFRWSAVLERLPGVPDQLLMAAAAIEPRWHVFLSVRFSSGAITVDPTWDAGLRHMGFSVNARLEPPNDMTLAVPPEDFYVDNPAGCLPATGPPLPMESPQATHSSFVRHKHYYVFVLRFNRWLEEGRMSAATGLSR